MYKWKSPYINTVLCEISGIWLFLYASSVFSVTTVKNLSYGDDFPFFLRPSLHLHTQLNRLGHLCVQTGISISNYAGWQTLMLMIIVLRGRVWIYSIIRPNSERSSVNSQILLDTNHKMPQWISELMTRTRAFLELINRQSY